MAHAQDDNSLNQEKPLLSLRHKIALAVIVGFMALFSLTLTYFSPTLGHFLLLGDHSDRQTVRSITIGLDQLQIEENAIRFERQRHDGKAMRIDLALMWPEMRGYDVADRLRFDDASQTNRLIFIQISQSTMSQDMSGRVAPIYTQLFDGAPQQGPYGLTIHRLKPGSGYDGEILYTAHRPGNADYAIRCMDAPKLEDQAIDDCQRDIHLGKDLSVLYRFSAQNLADWQKIDDAVSAYVSKRITANANP